MRRDFGIILGILLALQGMLWSAERESVSVEDAFWAYDDGKIGEEDLEELLRLIEAGDGEEACTEWEALGLEPCQKSWTERLHGLNFRGAFQEALSLDSAGNLRNQQMRLALGLWRISGEVRFKSQGAQSPTVKYRRLQYKGRRFSFAAGNLSSIDVGSAVALQKRLGGILTVRLKPLTVGAFAWEDSTAGFHTAIGSPKNIQLFGMGNFSLDGFRGAFLRAKNSTADVQVLYSKHWNTPLLYVSGTSEKGKNSLPLRLRFRAYLHKNDTLHGIFRLPKIVETHRAVGNSTVQIALGDMNLRLLLSVAVPLDTGKARSVAEISCLRRQEYASLGMGTRVSAVGEDFSTTLLMQSGVSLFKKDSLFAEWRLTPRHSLKTTLYEIRPGFSIPIEEAVRAKVLCILRGPQKKPLVVRLETQMTFSTKLYGKSSLELRSERFQDLHLWRFGFEFDGMW